MYNNTQKTETIRLAKYIALTGLCSRRAATRYIRDGRITYGTRLANHTDTICISYHSSHHKPDANQAVVLFDGVPLSRIEDKHYWLFHKAKGTDSRLLKHDPSSLLHLLPSSPRLYPVGRLDKDSRGLLLLTNDGLLTQKLLHPKFGHKKTYRVQVNKEINNTFLQTMAMGVQYKNIKTLPCKVTKINNHEFEIILTQGLNRQIRRMAKALGYHVTDLKRIAIEKLTLGHLPEGGKRELTPLELDKLKKLI